MTPEFELIATAVAELAEPYPIGPTEAGLREAIPIVGGTVEGLLLNGRIEPGGVDWCLTRADGGRRGQIGQIRSRCPDGVLDEAGDHPANDLIDQPTAFEARPPLLDRVDNPGDKRNRAGDVVEPEQVGPQPVVDVMADIGDVVGLRRRLRFDAGETVERQRK